MNRHHSPGQRHHPPHEVVSCAFLIHSPTRLQLAPITASQCAPVVHPHLTSFPVLAVAAGTTALLHRWPDATQQAIPTAPWSPQLVSPNDFSRSRFRSGSGDLRVTSAAAPADVLPQSMPHSKLHAQLPAARLSVLDSNMVAQEATGFPSQILPTQTLSGDVQSQPYQQQEPGYPQQHAQLQQRRESLDWTLRTQAEFLHDMVGWLHRRGKRSPLCLRLEAWALLPQAATRGLPGGLLTALSGRCAVASVNA